MTNNRVYICGAGPGDPGLLTVKTSELIRSADAILYDRLVSAEVLALAPACCVMVDVGKRNDEGGSTQDEINAAIVAHARKYKRVVRLKGGDPFVFGRGGEEAEVLKVENIPYEVVPGITSPLSVPAYAGIPVTHRDEASQLHILTGHGKAGTVPFDCEKIARLDGTIVILMGMKHLPEVIQGLMEHGMERTRPIAIIQNGTRQNQRQLVSTLEHVLPDLEKTPLSPPSIIVIGDVVKYSEKLGWFLTHTTPMRHKKILVTRAESQSAEFAALLRTKGAQALCEPFIAIEKVDSSKLFDDNCAGFDRNYDVILFNSSNGAEIFFTTMNEMKFDARIFGCVKIGVIGTGTKAVVERHGILPDFMPDEYTVKALLPMGAALCTDKRRMLIVTSDLSPVDTDQIQDEYSITTEKAVLYRTKKLTVSSRRMTELAALKPEMITVMSSSTASALKQSIDGLSRDQKAIWNSIPVCAIGPETAATLKNDGFTEIISAETYTMTGMIKAMERFFTNDTI